MGNIERYVADQTEGGDEIVLDTSRDPARILCMCRSDEDAEMIARALNNSEGAVERAERAEAEVARLRREYQVGYVDGRRDERGSSLGRATACLAAWNRRAVAGFLDREVRTVAEDVLRAADYQGTVQALRDIASAPTYIGPDGPVVDGVPLAKIAARALDQLGER